MNSHPSNTCDLCGLTLRYGNFKSTYSGQTYYFCCAGCLHVFRILMEASSGSDPRAFRETEIFKRCQEMGIVPRSEEELRAKSGEPVEVPRAEGVSSDAAAAACAERNTEALTLDVKVEDMWCPACAWIIEEAVKKISGVTGAVCNFSTDRFRCEYDPVRTSPSRIIQTISGLGYRALFADEEAGSGAGIRDLVRLGISAFLTMNVMMLSFGLYSGFFTDLSSETVRNLSWPIGIMAAVVIVYGGKKIYHRAFGGLFSAAFSMEALIAIGSLTVFFYSTYNLISGSIHLYYDTACMLVTLVLLGKFLEGRAKDTIHEDLGAFFSLRPKKVRICSDGFPDGRYVAGEQLSKGDIFRLEQDDIVPADGIILEGGGAVDESSLTGEPLPGTRLPGDGLKSGSRIVHGSFKVRAEAVGQDSTLGRMIEIMEKALGTKSAVEGRTDRLLQWFVPAVLLISAGTGLVCWVFGLAPEEAMIRAVTVLVISCPCTLGIAIPLARVAGISMAGKKGILVRDFSAFEKVGRIDTFVFDKTGTVTEGRWILQETVIFQPFERARVLAWAAGLEASSDHYIAVEIREQAAKEGIRQARVDRVEVFSNGISGHVGKDQVKIGAGEFLEREFRAVSQDTRADPEEKLPSSRVYMSFGGRPCAVFVFGDRIKQGSVEAIRELKTRFDRLAVISGDDDGVTRSVGRLIGIDEAGGGLLPDEKADYVDALKKKGRTVAMVGDGINDAPALLRADLAFAVHSGANIGKEAADLTLMRGDLRQIADFLHLSGKVNRKVYQNLTFSFLYNSVSIPIAMSGLLNPLIAVCAMLMSSLSVIGNTLLLLRKK